VKVWGYGANGGTKGITSPGAMIRAKYGESFVIRWNNTLDKAYTGGIGVPESATHLHNMHTASESDGFPGDYVTSGYYRDSHYTMCRAGYDQSPATNGNY
jgi:FtsP/CotA-like multicopper oxidase with cupredoxin domain